MNSKQSTFIISQAIVVIFVLFITLLLNHVLNNFFMFLQEDFIVKTIIVVLTGLFLFFILSKPLLIPLFKSDENLQKALKETIHELNIPVATIDINIKMLEKKINDEKSLQRLSRIKKANKKLLNLYEDMEYSIKKELEKIEKEEFYINEIINQSLEDVQDVKAELSFDVKVDDILINCDKNGFKIMFNNLLSNAIKHNIKNGFVKISFDNNILSIYNTGKSINTENIFTIFEKYYQENSNKEGFGLGLFMVKEYCDKNSILINIQRKNKGTIFHLNLSSIK